jgi:hypothetical protein
MTFAIAHVRNLLAILATEDPDVIGYYTAKDKIIEAVPALLDRLEKLEAVVDAARDRLVSYELGTDRTGRNARDEWQALTDAITNLDKP